MKSPFNPFSPTSVSILELAQGAGDPVASAERLGRFFLVFAPQSGEGGVLSRTGERLRSTDPRKLATLALRVAPMTRRPTSQNAFVTIGRLDGNDLVLEDASVSRLHAIARPCDEGFLLEDAGSRNGTTVNGEPVAARDRKAARLLQRGDVVAFGGAVAVFIATAELAALICHGQYELEAAAAAANADAASAAARVATMKATLPPTQTAPSPMEGVGTIVAAIASSTSTDKSREITRDCAPVSVPADALAEPPATDALGTSEHVIRPVSTSKADAPSA